MAISTPCTPQTPFDEYLRSKQASMAAQCYMLCIKLMVSMLEQMLQSLLASPFRASYVDLGNMSPSQATQNPSLDSAFSSMNGIAENLRLGDLHSPQADPFGSALSSTINVLRIGSRLLGRIEQFLGIPSKLRAGNFPSNEQVGLDQSLSPSLPARFVASIWEDEAATNNRSSVTYFRRCRAAILGLSTYANSAGD